MEETFRLKVHYGDRPWANVGEITITDEKLLAMLTDPTVRFELARNLKHGDHEIQGMFLSPMQLPPASKIECGDLYEHTDGHTYYCNLKPNHGLLHDSVVDEFDLYDGQSVTWLDSSKRVGGVAGG